MVRRMGWVVRHEIDAEVSWCIEGAKVVTLGVQKLDPAQKVRIVSSLAF